MGWISVVYIYFTYRHFYYTVTVCLHTSTIMAPFIYNNIEKNEQENIKLLFCALYSESVT